MVHETQRASRRGWLAACTLAAGTVLAGCPGDGSRETSREPPHTPAVASRTEDTSGTGAVSTTTTDTQPSPSTVGWGQFRGDSANSGIRPSGAGPDSPLAVDWEAPLTERVEADEYVGVNKMSSPVLADDTVVVAASLLKETADISAVLFGLDAATGQREWARALPRGLESAQSPQPVTVDDAIVCPRLTADGTTGLVVDPADGTVRDRFEFTQYLHRASVADGMAYGGEYSLLSVTLPEGRVEWSNDVDTTTGRQTTVGDRAVYQPFGSGFVAVERDTGDRLWRADYSTEGAAPRSFTAPTLTDQLAVAAGDVDAYAGRREGSLLAFDPSTGTEAWRFSPAVDSQPASESARRVGAVYGYPLVMDDTVYVTGARFTVAESAGSAPVSQRFVDVETSLFAVESTAGRLVWETTAPVAPVPVTAGDTLYLVSSDRIETVSVDEQRVTGSVQAPETLFQSLSPAISHGRLFVSARHGVVAFGSG